MDNLSAAQLSLMAESDYADWSGGKGGDLLTHRGMATGFIEGHIIANAKAQRRITKLEGALETIRVMWANIGQIENAADVARAALADRNDYGG